MDKITFKDRVIALGKGFLTLFIFYFSTLLIYYILSIFIESFNINIENFWLKNIFNSLASIISLLLFLLIFKKQLKEDWKIYKENKQECNKIGKSYWLYGLIIMVVSNLIIGTFDASGISANEAGNRSIITNIPIFAAISMIITGPIIEELVFRAGFKNAFKNAKPFAIFTGLLFGLVHLLASFDSFSDILTNWSQLLYIIPYSALGIMFGIAYFKTNTIFTTIRYHIIHNAITIGMLFLASILALF